MSHEILEIAGKYQFAYTGAPGWHGLGNPLPLNASIEEWAHASGLSFEVMQSPMYYRPACDAPADGAPKPAARKVPGKVAQYHSVTGAFLGTVSDGYVTHQPREMLELFETWVKAGGCTLETAGVLLGGSVYFALARIGEDIYIDGQNGRDGVAPYIYLSTSCNGTRATTTILTPIRVVCKNTDSAAMNGAQGQTRDSQSHRAEFDPSQARAYIENANKAFGAYIETARRLADVRVNAERAEELTAKLLGAADIEAAASKRAYGAILELFNGAGAGSTLDTANGTAWGWYNACTDYTDHKVRATSDDARHLSAQSGAGARFKARAFELATSI